MYTMEELYKKNIRELREVGKSNFIKGATNMSKADLVARILEKTESVALSGAKSIQAPIVTDALSAVSFAAATLEQAQTDKLSTRKAQGICVFSCADYAELYDYDFSFSGVYIPKFVLLRYKLYDGCTVVGKTVMFENKSYMTEIETIDGASVGADALDGGLPVRRVFFAANPFSFLAERAALDIKQNPLVKRCVVLPFALHEEIAALRSLRCLTLTVGYENPLSRQLMCARLCASKLREDAVLGASCILYADADRLFRAFLSGYSAQETEYRVSALFASASKYKGGGNLEMLFSSANRELVNLLKSMAT